MKKMIMTLLVSLPALATSPALTPETVTCPEGLKKTDYITTMSKSHQVGCVKKLENGDEVRHGSEYTFSSQGHVIDERYYVDGYEREKPAEVPKSVVEKKAEPKKKAPKKP